MGSRWGADTTPRPPGWTKLGATTADQLHNHLLVLRAERATASLEGYDEGPYLDDLLPEIQTTEHAFVGAVVTEIATCRAEAGGCQVG